jgi:hypothetical protein
LLPASPPSREEEIAERLSNVVISKVLVAALVDQTMDKH